MKKISIIGAGKIGSLAALLLARSKQYQIQLVDQCFLMSDQKRLFQLYPDMVKQTVDVTNRQKLNAAVANFKSDAVISCLPYFLNKNAAQTAHDLSCAYFDLTEDVAATNFVRDLAKNSKMPFVPQCGLAPGMIGLIANDLIQQFDSIETVEMRVGALPQFSNNGLKYALTWSTDGLINEYDNPCTILRDGKIQIMPPLESLESIEVLGEQYEAFSTSGGLGSLVELYGKRVNKMNYKTIRYPGHCEKIRFLMRDLNLSSDRDMLKTILEKAIPRTWQDLVLMLVNVVGIKDKELQAKQYIKKIMPVKIDGFHWSAIQITTAAGLCAVVDVVLNNEKEFSGFVYQEQISLEKILKTPFGEYYQEKM